MAFLRKFRDLILDFLFPGEEALLALESFSPGKILEVFPRSDLKENDTLALWSYRDEGVKGAVWQLKYKGNRKLAQKLGLLLYGTILSELHKRKELDKDRVILIPMPISPKRLLERGWNQAELLTRVIEKCDKRRVFIHLPEQLLKTRHTESQTLSSSRRERLENLKATMEVLDPATVKGKVVVLVDDVTTTGATFTEAKRALHFAGARLVLCFALAH